MLCGRVVKVLVVGELLSLYRGGGARGDAAADEFNQCRATTKSQRYLDNLYRCLPGRYPDVVTPPPIGEPSIVMSIVCLSVCVFVYPRSSLRNYRSDLYQIFVSTLRSVFLWRRSDALFADKPRLLDVAAQLKRSSYTALGLTISCVQ